MAVAEPSPMQVPVENGQGLQLSSDSPTMAPGFPSTVQEAEQESQLDASGVVETNFAEPADEAALALLAKANAEPPWDQLGESEQNAITQYANSIGKNESEVTLAMVLSSPEGLLHWACQGQDWGSRSHLSQSFFRAIKKQPKFQEMYKDMSEPLKKEFRATWGIKRDWNFTKEVKTIRSDYSKSEADAGEFMTQYQVAMALGLAAFPQDCKERTHILSQAGRSSFAC